jgi:aryl-alcohol dehydrogenase-like predicted oxidoreductase
LNRRARTITQAVVVAAEGLGLSPLEVAIAWVRDRPGVTSSIVGARTGAQLKGILRSEEVEIPAQVRIALDEVSANAERGE